RHGAPRKPTHQHTTHNHDRQDRLTSTYRHNPSSKNDPHETRRTAGTTPQPGDTQKPPRAHNPQRQKNMKRRDNDARNQTGPQDRRERRSGLRLAESQPRQRERERERDASATLTRPITDPPLAHGLSDTLFPKENTRKTTPSQKRPGPSPKGPALPVEVDHRDRPKTRPYVRRTLDVYEHVATIYQGDASCQVV